MCEKCNEHDRAAYNELIAKVAKVNAEAAEWLRTEAPELDPFHYDEDLGCCFRWEDTPQGHAFWLKIALDVECL